MKKNISCMAFAKGSESTDAVEVKRYFGVAPVQVLAVNPTKAELEKLYGTTLDKEPEYTGETDGVKYARIDFIVKTVADKCNGIDFTTKVTYFLKDSFKVNKDGTKVQVIDKYGRTAWVTKEQAKNHEVPMYTNGPANIDAGYRPCYDQEEFLTGFIKAYLGIPNVMSYIDKKWVMVDNPQDCEAQLSDIKALFAGNFKELKEIISYQPNNKVKVLFGVKTSQDGKQYQTAYNQVVLKNSTSSYNALNKDLTDRKRNGAYSTVEFGDTMSADGSTYEVHEICEYKVTPTDLSQTNTEVGMESSVNDWFN